MKIWFFPGFILIAWIALGISLIPQCSDISKTAAEHEQDILNICLAVERSDMIDCIKREWDRVNDAT